MKKSVKTAIASAVAAAAIAAAPAGAATPPGPGDDPTLSETTSAYAGIRVAFPDTPVSFPHPPRVIDGTTMVPGQALLEGFGYQVEWDADKQILKAVHKSGSELVFQVGLREAILNSRKVSGLPAAPYIEQNTVFIPLRIAAVASGMTVSWDSAKRVVVVRDPHALPRIRVSTRADGGASVAPDKLLAYMKENAKVNAEIQLIPSEHYRDKTNLMIAAGDLQDIMLLQDHEGYQDELLPAIAIDLTDKIKAFPRLQKLAESGRWINGKLYGIPKPADPHDAAFPAVRQDWLNALGLAQPKTMDELYEVMKRFAETDPDGNGKHDTYGLAGYADGAGLGGLAWVEHVFTGSPTRFSVKDGQVVDHAVSPEETEALAWLARAYADGLIDPEFPVLNKSQFAQRLSAHTAGIAAVTVAEAGALSAGDADWTPLSDLKAGVSGKPVSPWNTSHDMYIISSMSKNDPHKLLEWLDRGFAMAESGEWERMPGFGMDDRTAAGYLFGRPDLANVIDGLDSLSNEQKETYRTAVQTWRRTSYEGQTLPQAEALWRSGQFAEINSNLELYKLKVILGQASLDDWNQYIARLTASSDYRNMMNVLNKLVP
ncbi:ABC transporter substrate-binding protein [Paenibacillus sp. 32O-W]|uniref:extracellular solute-binding protein n=1 Tax=Paenibacillus sp. 32O-W TaxID=1695218 RepID=UPI00072266F2|nr:extracellular solute-binding protein [Paenibacillus sp. 32O-W]ALS27114.1 ABC transporter substrate-binding protein [Paenibacillus sp. 32O-W]